MSCSCEHLFDCENADGCVVKSLIEDLCVEKEGKCQCDPCRCNNGDTAEPGW